MLAMLLQVEQQARGSASGSKVTLRKVFSFIAFTDTLSPAGA
jgi:hypothetical protein